jgi:guanylate kinase
MPASKKKIIILAGPSGSGKTTVAHHLIHLMPELSFSISATTRPMRVYEENGKDYHFLTDDEFRDKIDKDDFIEYEEVYAGVLYGTMKSELENIWKRGQIPILDIDVHGALNVKNHFAPQALTIFVHPVSIDNLKARLHKRATETEDSFNKRIHKSEEELNQAPKFDRIVYNDNLEDAFSKAELYINEYLLKDKKLQS